MASFDDRPTAEPLSADEKEMLRWMQHVASHSFAVLMAKKLEIELGHCPAWLETKDFPFIHGDRAVLPHLWFPRRFRQTPPDGAGARQGTSMHHERL
jgi:hypothetical protein